MRCGIIEPVTKTFVSTMGEASVAGTDDPQLPALIEEATTLPGRAGAPSLRQQRVTWDRTTWRAYEFLKPLGQAPVPEAVGRIVSEARITDGVTAFTGGEWRIVIEH